MPSWIGILFYFLCVCFQKEMRPSLLALFCLNFKRVSSRKMLLLNTIVVWLIKAWLELPTGFSLSPPPLYSLFQNKKWLLLYISFLSLLLLVDRVRALISWTVQGRWKLRLNDACSLFLSLSHKRILLGLDKDNAQSSKALCVPVRKPFFLFLTQLKLRIEKKTKI